MARPGMFSRKVLGKAMPAVLLAIFIMLSLAFLIRYTDAFYLVILLWIVVPVLAVKLARRISGFLRREG